LPERRCSGLSEPWCSTRRVAARATFPENLGAKKWGGAYEHPVN
jgi:hypothetical protein